MPMKYLLAAASVLLVAVFVVFFLADRHPADPAMRQMGDLVDLAERLCLSNITDSRSADVKIKLIAVKGLDANAGVDARRSAARGAADGLDDAVKQLEDGEIRKCMTPFAEQIREVALKPR